MNRPEKQVTGERTGRECLLKPEKEGGGEKKIETSTKRGELVR